MPDSEKSARRGAAWLAAICLVLTLTGCQDETQALETEGARPVKTMRVQAASESLQKAFPGMVRAAREVDVSFRVDGTINRLPVVAGQEVKRGELLAGLDPRDFIIRRDRAKAAYVEAENQYRRYSLLVKQGAVARAEYDKIDAAYKTAKANREEAEAALTDTRLLAPFHGVVAKRFVDNHQEVKAKERVAALRDVSHLEVEVEIPEADVVHYHSQSDYSLGVRLDAVPGLEMPARVSAFGSEADRVTRTFTVKAVFQAPEGLNVLPGMTAELVGRRRENGGTAEVCVPLSAVLADSQGRDMVWRVNPQTMTVEHLPVKTGRVCGQDIRVLAGLQPGDTIVTAGVHHLRQGMLVYRMKDEHGGERK
ncbi:MAG: efflux RND transporter periplasmic adaptor subunit [Deltaproteobacteria bacterium]|nr:efflux RND transporter periplasmic adaptor subunit [Deltaproteobacteria bacterium]